MCVCSGSGQVSSDLPQYKQGRSFGFALGSGYSQCGTGVIDEPDTQLSRAFSQTINPLRSLVVPG